MLNFLFPPAKAGGKTDSKADDPKAGADVGKIVNLMAGDANKVRILFRIRVPYSCPGRSLKLFLDPILFTAVKFLSPRLAPTSPYSNYLQHLLKSSSPRHSCISESYSVPSTLCVVRGNTETTSRLLGLSAFAGFGVLIIGWPLNNFVAKRAVRIQKGVSNARDKRMGVLNELIGAVSSI